MGERVEPDLTYTKFTLSAQRDGLIGQAVPIPTRTSPSVQVVGLPS